MVIMSIYDVQHDSAEELEEKAIMFHKIKNLIDPIKKITCNTCRKIKRIIDGKYI